MKSMNLFDPLETPLNKNKGLNLVEASAGTGKTYALSSLFVRLLIDFNLNINDILVITFTNAATNELKERIRARIKDAINGFLTGDTDDLFLKRLIEKTPDKTHAIDILTNAINSFDMASIFTIHGFCLRVLKQYAFECGSLFDIDLEEEDDDILVEIVKDFWRNCIFNESKFFLNYAFKNLNVNHLHNLARKIIINPSLFIIENESFMKKNFMEGEQKKKELECIEAFEKTSLAWKVSKDALFKFIIENPSKKRKKLDEQKVKAIFDEIEKYFNSGYPVPLPSLPKWFYDLGHTLNLEDALKNNNLTTEAHFFTLWEMLKRNAEGLSDFYDNKLIFLKKMLMDYVEKELKKRKQSKNIRSFNDLLVDVHRAISAPFGINLVEEIKNRYRAILIDEFQDTDPLQYEIIKHIYADGQTIVFIIGDPKQSIYSFRGADIFSYIKAANDASNRWTLEFNYRSSKRLIKAVNTLFEHIKNPFVFDNIDFKPVRAAGTEKQNDLIIKGQIDPSPLKIWFLEGKGGKTIKVNDAAELISKAVADEVATLLYMGDKKEILIDDRPLTAKDIAIIVRKNQEAIKIQKALNKLGIPGVIYTTDSVFMSNEAEELFLILKAIGEPSDESKIKGALITSIMGLKGNELIEIIEDEIKWNECFEKFEFYRELWLRSGFITMARTLISNEGVKRRLISMENGERRLTNLLHVIELIHKACVNHRLNIEGVLKWLSDKIEREKGSTSEEYQMRLETDEEAVKILTIHRSKGLEFPVVFCPFTFSNVKVGRDEKFIMFHDKTRNYSLTIDIGLNPFESSKKYMEMEELAENVRLLYVSLTRAKKRCYLVWGMINQSEDSGFAYILYSHSHMNENFSLEALKEYIKNLSGDNTKAILNRIVEKSSGTIELINLPEYKGIRYVPKSVEGYLLSPKTFKGTIDRTWNVVSFTSLISKRPQVSELPDRDEAKEKDFTVSFIKTVEKKDIFSFPQGTKAGLFIHDVLQHMDFSLKDLDEFKRLLDRKLIQYGFEKEWLELIYEKLKELVNITLKSHFDTFSLKEIDNKKRLNEMEFYLPLNMIDANGLETVFIGYRNFPYGDGLNGLIRDLGFTPVRGMMRGFIDMVFEYNEKYYIIDWKSNFLGDRLDDYSFEKLSKVMIDEYYFLQYHFYILALHSFLSLRQKDYAYEKNIGGVFYIFVRGIDCKRDDCGVFFHLPEKGFVEALNKYLKSIE